MRLIRRQYNYRKDVSKNINPLIKRDGWFIISGLSQKLSEDFIDKYKYRIDWHWISQYQKLSESFIEKHKDKVDWINISVYQKLSESFIEKYKDKVNWYLIFEYQNLSPEFREKWKYE